MCGGQIGFSRRALKLDDVQLFLPVCVVATDSASLLESPVHGFRFAFECSCVPATDVAKNSQYVFCHSCAAKGGAPTRYLASRTIHDTSHELLPRPCRHNNEMAQTALSNHSKVQFGAPSVRIAMSASPPPFIATNACFASAFAARRRPLPLEYPSWPVQARRLLGRPTAGPGSAKIIAGRLAASFACCSGRTARWCITGRVVPRLLCAVPRCADAVRSPRGQHRPEAAAVKEDTAAAAARARGNPLQITAQSVPSICRLRRGRHTDGRGVTGAVARHAICCVRLSMRVLCATGFRYVTSCDPCVVGRSLQTVCAHERRGAAFRART
eukprot:6092943-Prymnesium_polylepis.1